MKGVLFRKWPIRRPTALALIVAISFSTIVSAFLFPSIASAATRTWDGGDVDDQNWSSCDNWSDNTCPTSSDTVVFNGTSVEDSSVDAGFTGTVDAVQVNSGYTGTTTLARDLTLDNSGGFSQSAGTFDISGFTMTLSATGGSLTVSGGTFLGTSATTTFTGDSFASTQTLTCTGTFPAIVSPGSGRSKFTLASGCNATLASAISKSATITLAGNATAQTGSTITVNNNTFASGNLTITGSLAGLSGLATTSFIGDSYATGQTLTCTGTYPGVVNSTLESPFTLASGCSATLPLTLVKEGNITLAGDATALSGATNTLSGSANAAGALTVTGSMAGLSGLATTTFSANSFIISQTLTCTGTWPGILSPGSGEGPFTLASGCSATLAQTISKTGNITLAGDATALSGSTITLSGSTNANGDRTVTGSLAGLSPLATTTFSGNGAAVGRSQTLTCTGTWPGALDPYSNNSPFTLASGCSATLGSTVSKNGTITINGTLTTVDFNTSASTITVNSGGTLKVGNGQTTFKTPVLNSGSTVEYTGASTYTTLKAGSSYSNLVISGSGSFSTSTALTITDAFTQTAGTFTPSATTTFSGSDSATVTTTSGSNFSHVDVNKTSATVTLAGSGLTTTGNLFITAGTLDASAAGCSSAACNLTVGGHWSNSGTFTARTGTVTLNGSSQSIAGATTFYKLTKSAASTDTLSFAAAVTQTITNALTLNGASGARLSLRSLTDGSQWGIDPQGSRTVSYLDVKDSNNVNASNILATDGTSNNSLNNTGWSFTGPSISTLGPSSFVDGSWSASTTPRLTFTTVDSDSNPVRFEFQLSASDSFASYTVDYLSATATPAATSFTVGQAAGSGTYLTGSAGQTLSEGQYYWRVRASNTVSTSSYSTANSGAIAFGVDTTAPSTGSITFSDVGQSSITASAVSASDSGSGLSTYLFAESITGSLSTQSSSNSWARTGLSAATTYSFVVGVTDAAGNTATSSSASTATLAASSGESNQNRSGSVGGGGNSRPMCTLGVSPTIISAGSQALLTWTSSGAIAAVIDNRIGSVPVNGTRFVKAPVGLNTYTATFTGVTGLNTLCNTTLLVTTKGAASSTPPGLVGKTNEPKAAPGNPKKDAGNPPQPPTETTVPPEQNSNVPTTTNATPPTLPTTPASDRSDSPAVIINDGASKTASEIVQLTLSAPRGTIEMILSDPENPTSSTITVAYAPTMTWDLCPPGRRCDEGRYQVAAVFVATDGSRSQPVTDSIHLDTSPTFFDDLLDRYGPAPIALPRSSPFYFVVPIRSALAPYLETPASQAITGTVKTGAVALGLVGIAGNIVASGLGLSDLWLLLLRILAALVSSEYLRRRGRSWGTVYDSITKRPLDPAMVTVYRSDGSEVTSAITDLDGRFGFLLERGTYTVTAKKSHYVFPSVHAESFDPIYQNQYHGEPIEVEESDAVLVRDIPLDPVGFDWNEYEKNRRGVYLFYSRMDRPLSYAAIILMPVGALLSALSLIANPSPFNLGIIVVYVFLGVSFFTRFAPHLRGSIQTPDGAPLPFAILKVSRRGSPAIVAHSVADRFGHYYLLLPQGDEFAVAIYVRNGPADEDFAVAANVVITASRGYYRNKIVIDDAQAASHTIPKPQSSALPTQAGRL